jgi:hypothetical protein
VFPKVVPNSTLLVHLLVNLSKFFQQILSFFSRKKKLGKNWRIVFGFSNANLTNLVVVVGIVFCFFFLEKLAKFSISKKKKKKKKQPC